MGLVVGIFISIGTGMLTGSGMLGFLFGLSAALVTARLGNIERNTAVAAAVLRAAEERHHPPTVKTTARPKR